MIDLLMLGIIPGTDIQINFADWLFFSAVIGSSVCIAVAIRHRRQLAWTAIRSARLLRHTVLLAIVRVQLARQLRKTATVS